MEGKRYEKKKSKSNAFHNEGTHLLKGKGNLLTVFVNITTLEVVGFDNFSHYHVPHEYVVFKLHVFYSLFVRYPFYNHPLSGPW
jgi:hypothetical protein